ncbi:MAG: hypothetical protein RR429_03355 [Hafnia sp.]
MEFLKLYSKEIFSVVVALLTWVLNNYFKAKVNLSYGFQHGFTFLVQEPLRDANQNVISESQLVHTRSLILVNEGRESATKITLVFNYKPMHLNFWPIYHYEESLEKDKRYIVTFDSLSPKNSIRCEILSINQEVPEILSIRSTECVAKQVSLIPVKAMSSMSARVHMLLYFIGLGAFVYLVIMLLQWLLISAG